MTVRHHVLSQRFDTAWMGGHPPARRVSRAVPVACCGEYLPVSEHLRAQMIRRRRWLALAVSLLAAGAFAAGCSSAGSGPGSGPPALSGTRPSGTPAAVHRPPPKPPIGIIGRYTVGERTLRLAEGAHTGPGGSEVGPRRLPTLVRYPVRPAGGPYPLIVFAPGFLQCGGVYRDLLHAWASAGYVVAVVTFPRTNCLMGAAADEADLVNQPADVSYVISRLIALSARPSGALSGLIDRAKIAIAGHSDGGDTVAAAAADTCCADHRVAAAVVLAGAEWPPLPGHYFPHAPPAPPMLFVQGSADPINPPWTSLQLYQADHTGPRYYLDVFGAGHLTPYEGDTAQERLVARVTTEFLDHYVAGQHPAAAMTRLGDVPGVAVLVRGGRLPPA
jgi:dienelactone hydrolase